MAPADTKGTRLLPPGATSRPHNATDADAKTTDKKKGAPDIPPGADPLPADGASFVEAVHGTKPSRTSSPSATPHSNAKWQLCKASTDSTAWTRTSCAVPWAFRHNS
jgi:hypothetical protein